MILKRKQLLTVKTGMKSEDSRFTYPGIQLENLKTGMRSHSIGESKYRYEEASLYRLSPMGS